MKPSVRSAVMLFCNCIKSVGEWTWEGICLRRNSNYAHLCKKRRFFVWEQSVWHSGGVAKVPVYINLILWLFRSMQTSPESTKWVLLFFFFYFFPECTERDYHVHESLVSSCRTSKYSQILPRRSEQTVGVIYACKYQEVVFCVRAFQTDWMANNNRNGLD